MELWAHRGGGIGPLENTLAGFKLAIQNHFTAVELDLMITADGHLVVHHDKCLGRLSELHPNSCLPHNATLSELSLAQLSAFSINNHPILLFVQLLNFLLKSGIQVNVELKAYSPSMAAKIGTALETLFNYLPKSQFNQIKKNWIFSSFNHSSLTRLASKQFNIALLFEKLRPDWHARAVQFCANAVHVHWSALSDEIIQEVLASGRKIRVYTVNQSEIYARCLSMGVHGVFTDRITNSQQLIVQVKQPTLPATLI